MNIANQQKPCLIAIAFSHYCEKVRWALDYLGIDYVEENHAPPFHRQYTARHGGSTVPVLVAENQAFTDSHDILQYLDGLATEKKIYPENLELRGQVETLEKLFDEKLGVATRTWGYYYAIHKPLKIAIAWGIKAPIIERIKIILAFPKIPQLLKQLYDITPESKDSALEGIREIFAIVSQELDSGKQFLGGDCLSAADITFAALASPIFRPQNHPVYSSNLSKMSPEIQTVREELLKTSAGKLVLRMYREHRYK